MNFPEQGNLFVDEQVVPTIDKPVLFAIPAVKPGLYRLLENGFSPLIQNLNY